jgi:hypothetical protein
MRKIGMNLKLLVFVIFSVFVGTSCSDYLDNEDQSKVKGDVFIRAFKEGDTIVYNRLYYAYSNYEMESVTVTGQDNDINIELDTISYKFTYAHIPARDTYTTERPGSGNFLFDVEFEDGTTELAEDYLEPVYVVPVDFTTLEWDTTSNKLIIEWDKVDNADYYGLVLKNENEEIVYESGIINNIYNRISLNNYTPGWKDGLMPESGDSLRIIHTTYSFEYQISTYDLQCLAVNDINIVAWGVPAENE